MLSDDSKADAVSVAAILQLFLTDLVAPISKIKIRELWQGFPSYDVYGLPIDSPVRRVFGLNCIELINLVEPAIKIAYAYFGSGEDGIYTLYY
ncbi:hypothetical protein RHMOL_Rhmol10G0174300 [Rhododendron molle]|uniref:Uncharacterized protein n=1 Tax=Rhododendron molle TaxID=49168 RepID=A0ACC0M3L6_RHOML|nr:hypothetical protein RHMOL_Rhmol10G0174300 [Rhododendron molle]